MSWVRIPPNPLRYRSFLVDSFKKIGDRKGVYRIDSGMAAATEQGPTTTITTIETTTTDPWMLLLYALKAPDDVIDYIILHELCHVKINDHSHHYWDLVRKYMQSYQEKIDWLNANTTSILI